MKPKRILIILFILLIFPLIPALSSGTDSTKYVYCEIRLTGHKPFTSKVTAYVVFSSDSPFRNDPLYGDVTDVKKTPAWDSVMDILNIMASRGWRYVDQYTTEITNQRAECFILKKEL